MTNSESGGAPAEPSATAPRVCVVSLRKIGRQAAWSVMSEFEDVIGELEDTDRIDLQPGRGFSLRRRVVQSLVWRQYSKRFTRLNPGIEPVSLKSDYDLFVFVCMNPWELLCLNAVHGWKERCRKKICFILEVWSGNVQNYEHLLCLLDNFDHVLTALECGVPAIQGVTRTPCSFMPPASDTLRFSPYPDPPPRSIDVYSMGRRSEGLHRKLLELARKRKIFYIYDTIPGGLVQPTDGRQHRELIANLAKRSRFFVTYPAKVDVSSESAGLSEAGARYYEGLASGAVMIGRPAETDSFKRDFHWPDSVITVGDTMDDFLELDARFEREPESFEALTRKNALEALRNHDWVHRWKTLLHVAGEAPGTKLAERESRLNDLAGSASPSSV